MQNEQIEAGAGASRPSAAARGFTPAQVDAWIEEAQPGARLNYHHGYSFAAEGSEALGLHLRMREAAGFIFLYQGRKDLAGARPYVAERSSRPSTREAPKRPLTLHEQAREFARRGGR